MSWKYGDDDDDDDDNAKQEEEWISENSYFWMILQYTPHVTVHQYFYTMPHSQKSMLSMLKVQYINLPACHFIGQEEQELLWNSKSANLFMNVNMSVQ